MNSTVCYAYPFTGSPVEQDKPVWHNYTGFIYLLPVETSNGQKQILCYYIRFPVRLIIDIFLNTPPGINAAATTIVAAFRKISWISF